MLLFCLNVSAQNERMLLLESFTNTGCVPCAQYNPAMDSLIANNPDKVAAIKYHVSWPSASDPMYLHNTSDNDAKTGYYGVNSVPHVVIDGNRFSGSPGQLSQGIIDQLQAIASPVELRLSHRFDEAGNTITVHVMGKTLANLVGDIRLFVGVIEKEIHFDLPPGPNGEHDFHDVMKKIMPSASGESLGENMPPNTAFDFTFTWSMENVYDLNRLDAIAWVQNHHTKEVYQACKSNSPTGLGEKTDTWCSVFPNPTSGTVTIVAESGQKVSVCNMAGQCVYEGTGEGPIQIDLKRFGSGVYAIRMGSETQRVIVR